MHPNETHPISGVQLRAARGCRPPDVVAEIAEHAQATLQGCGTMPGHVDAVIALGETANRCAFLAHRVWLLESMLGASDRSSAEHLEREAADVGDPLLLARIEHLATVFAGDPSVLASAVVEAVRRFEAENAGVRKRIAASTQPAR